MKRSVPFLLSLIIVAGCASTKVTNREELVSGSLPRPNMIWVYSFAATAADIPATSALASQVSDTSQTAQDVATGRKLGAEIASELVQQIQGMGMPATHADAVAARVHAWMEKP